MRRFWRAVWNPHHNPLKNLLKIYQTDLSLGTVTRPPKSSHDRIRAKGGTGQTQKSSQGRHAGLNPHRAEDPATQAKAS